MIRSGEHDLWDAYVATIRPRAHVAELVAMSRAIKRAFEPALRAVARDLTRAFRPFADLHR